LRILCLGNFADAELPEAWSPNPNAVFDHLQFNDPGKLSPVERSDMDASAVEIEGDSGKDPQ
jgi:hypothetical protein